VIGAGALAGALGALLGLGGGVFLVPFLHSVVGLPVKIAMATSLMTVIATSSAVSAEAAGRGVINLRLGMLLEVASAAGGYVGALTMERLDDRTIFLMFALVTAAIAVIMMTRLDRRNILDPTEDPGLLGGRFYDAESDREIVYRTRRLPLALGASFVAGSVSGILGIGGGVLKVPILNAWCGVPMRAAAATSALMIGVTAVSSVPIQYANGYVWPPVAAAAVLGVLVGSRAGLSFAGRAKAKWLKVLMAGVLAFVSLVYFMKLR
jgi:uncharacterized membrane protein YfcA